MLNNPNWGGVRKGVGRKREKEKLVKHRTKVIRVSESEYVNNISYVAHRSLILKLSCLINNANSIFTRISAV